MNKTIAKQIITGAALAAIAGVAWGAEQFGIPAVRWMAVAFVLLMILEIMRLKIKDKKLHPLRIGLVVWLILMGVAAYFVGTKPWVLLLLLLIIAATDIGAWFFGHLLGGDKMWERLSPGKTWSGQIAGIICGTLAAVLYGLLGTDTFLPQLMWIGISVALLSQYGDLTASWIKRKIGIKDFGGVLPGHGGLLDRFDGWIFVLPIVWLVMI